MARNTATQNGTAYNHEKIDGATLDGVTKTTAAKIAGELDLTLVESIVDQGEGEYKVELTVEGGFTAFGTGTATYAIKSIVGQGNPDTISVRIVEKRV